MALGLGEGAFLSTPLAVVVIGGLFTSTILTLILVPVLYLALERIRPAGDAAALAADGGRERRALDGRSRRRRPSSRLVSTTRRKE